MKAQLNGIEIPWSVTKLEQLEQSPSFTKVYSHGEYGLELIETFTSGFNYLKGQLFEVGLTGVGRTPAIITKVNDRDENGHLTYDILILLGNRTKSSIQSKERYIWRFAERQNDETIENFNKLISAIFTPEYGYDVYFSHEYGLDSICYLIGDSIISYDLNQIKSKQPEPINIVMTIGSEELDIGRGNKHPELANFGFSGTSNQEELPPRGETDYVIIMEENTFINNKKEGDDNEHY